MDKPSINTPLEVAEFVYLEEKYRCVFCKNVARGAMQTSCGHRLCQKCVPGLFRKENSVMCPAKEEECIELKKSDIFRDVSAQKEILYLPVFCRYSKNGCKETMPWKYFENHILDCPKQPVPCSNEEYGCTASIPKDEVEIHLQDCPFNMIDCKICGEKILANEQMIHLDTTCPNTNVFCPYECGCPPMARCKIEAHKEKCPMQPKKCTFSVSGCTFQGTEEEVSKHEREKITEHMNLIAMFTANMDLNNLKLRQQSQMLINERDQLMIAMEEKEKQLSDQKRELDTTNSKLRETTIRIVSLTERTIKMERQTAESIHYLEKMKQDIECLKELNRNAKASGQTGGMNFTLLLENAISEVTAHQQQIGLHSIKIAEMSTNLKILESSSFDGTLMWKISNYKQRKNEALKQNVLSLYSHPFFTDHHGYKMCGRVYLNGDGIGKNTHLSFFFAVMKGDYDAILQWPFKQCVTLMLLDQDGGNKHLADTFQPDVESSSFQRPTREMNIASGCPKFVSHQKLEKHPYLKDDTIFLKISVDTASLRSV